MPSVCKEYLEKSKKWKIISDQILDKKFKAMNILCDLVFVIFHYFVKNEDSKLRVANIIKFLATSLINLAEIFKKYFTCNCCCCCSRKDDKKLKHEVDEISKKLDNLKNKYEDEKIILKKAYKIYNKHSKDSNNKEIKDMKQKLDYILDVKIQIQEMVKEKSDEKK